MKKLLFFPSYLKLACYHENSWWQWEYKSQVSWMISADLEYFLSGQPISITACLPIFTILYGFSCVRKGQNRPLCGILLFEYYVIGIHCYSCSAALKMGDFWGLAFFLLSLFHNNNTKKIVMLAIFRNVVICLVVTFWSFEMGFLFCLPGL